MPGSHAYVSEWFNEWSNVFVVDVLGSIFGRNREFLRFHGAQACSKSFPVSCPSGSRYSPPGLKRSQRETNLSRINGDVHSSLLFLYYLLLRRWDSIKFALALEAWKPVVIQRDNFFHIYIFHPLSSYLVFVSYLFLCVIVCVLWKQRAEICTLYLSEVTVSETSCHLHTYVKTTQSCEQQNINAYLQYIGLNSYKRFRRPA
jgi:hypothetical protein